MAFEEGLHRDVKDSSDPNIDQHSVVMAEPTEAVLRNFCSLSKTCGLPPLLANINHVRWKYSAKTSQHDLVFNIIQDEVVGRLWLTYRPWRLDTKDIVVAFPNDLVIHPQHRDLRSIANLVRHVFDVAQGTAEFFYHGTNPNSDPIYRTLFKKRPLINLQCSAFLLRPRSLISRALLQRVGIARRPKEYVSGPQWARLLQRVLRFKSRVSVCEDLSAKEEEQFLSRFDQVDRLHCSRGSKMRKWRFHGLSELSYVVLWVKREHEVVGYVAYRDTAYGGYQARVVVDLCFASAPTVRIRLAVLAHIIDAPAELIFLAVNRENRLLKNWTRLPFLTIPRKLLPQSLEVYGPNKSHLPDNALAEQLEKDFRKSHFTLYDLDLF